MAYNIQTDMFKVGLNGAIAEIEKIEQALILTNVELSNVIIEKGVNIVKNNAETLVNADETLLEEKKQFATDYNVGNRLSSGREMLVRIENTSSEAKFIEYGTGMIGKGSPHPEPNMNWEYYKPSKFKRHYKGQDGWFHSSDYKDDNFFVGVPSQPFMWQSKNDIQKLLPSWFMSIFKKYTRGGM